MLTALPLLAGSGAPSMAVAVGPGRAAWCAGIRAIRRCGPSPLGGRGHSARPRCWRWRWAPGAGAHTAWHLGDLPLVARQWLWFLWPAWPLVLWTLWRWRRHLSHRHLSVPLVPVAVALVSNLAMAGSDRALMLGLPGMAVLAAFALPTLKRSTSAAIDWLSMFFFTLCAITIWVIYVAMQTGVPAKPAANVAKLAPGFEASFSAPALALAVAGTLAWLWLVRWRTGRHREALWKSLVLPAGGVALCWLLLMTLWLPLLDYARSPRPWVERIAAPGAGATPASPHPGCRRPPWRRWSTSGRWRVDARPGALDGACALCHARDAPAGCRAGRTGGLGAGRPGAAADRARRGHAGLPPPAGPLMPRRARGRPVFRPARRLGRHAGAAAHAQRRQHELEGRALAELRC